MFDSGDGAFRQEEVGSENRRNTRTKLTPKKAESSSSGCRFDSQSSRKDGTLQKIGDFLQSSPTLLGSKAKKMMSLVSGRLDPDSAAVSSSLSLRAKRGRKKLYRPEISCPMDMPPHPMINQETDGEGQSDHDIIKRRLRSRVAKSWRCPPGLLAPELPSMLVVTLAKVRIKNTGFVKLYAMLCA
ncbi:kinesin-like protein KIF20B [Fundulus heteroclitus]|uniref:kinesin-like protein KIF20B n=1 Tax=Fundulus heteroclitus TaxID=8078 RepID=UPI00165C39AE|nr:kinesin-like protein KIF20B [Fundulus heteroclitus]